MLASALAPGMVIPALTLSYFLSPNLAVELFCCFAKHEIDGKGTIANLGEIADTWIFPPALTLQYHFTSLGRLEPYVGAGDHQAAGFHGRVGVRIDHGAEHPHLEIPVVAACGGGKRPADQAKPQA